MSGKMPGHPDGKVDNFFEVVPRLKVVHADKKRVWTRYRDRTRNTILD